MSIVTHILVVLVKLFVHFHPTRVIFFGNSEENTINFVRLIVFFIYSDILKQNVLVVRLY